jgi:RHS repeat-associated protein
MWVYAYDARATHMTLSATYAASAASALPPRYTGKERDTESGNDYFGARYYNSATGRWLSPDWSAQAEPVPYAKLGDPQTLNLYAYVGNNPLVGIDPYGHFAGAHEYYNEMNGMLDQAEQINKDVQKSNQAQQQNTTQAPDNTLLAQNNTPPPPGRTPAQGATPDSTTVIPDGKGGSTTRTYGPDGRATTDVDKGHDHGAGDPHAHDWDWGKKPPRQPARPLTPEEQANVKRVAAGAAAIGTGYIIYRVIRFLPSLAPPLWPTIPANAIIP